jgi:hypothetical protein
VRPGKKEKRWKRTTFPPLATELLRYGNKRVEEIAVQHRLLCPES